MITENLSTLKINKLTQAQYDRELAAGRINENELYLTPDEVDYMEVMNPVGTGSFSMNRAADSVIGAQSSTFGVGNTASGDYSYAKGVTTHATGVASSAEGILTISSGYASHTEGSATRASGDASHAEGNGTRASSDYQHSQGKYNIEDADDVYAHIVGNGESDNTRSNAHTLDWNGNAWFAGDVYVGSTSGTNMDAGSVRLATINEALPPVTSADNGKVLMVVNGRWQLVSLNLTVDENGVITM